MCGTNSRSVRRRLARVGAQREEEEAEDGEDRREAHADETRLRSVRTLGQNGEERGLAAVKDP